MCESMCVSTFVCGCMCLSAHRDLSLCLSLCVYICVYVYVFYVCVSVHGYLPMSVHACAHICVFVCVSPRVCLFLMFVSLCGPVLITHVG